MSEIIKNRYEFVFFFDVENGNPNGDPDAGNHPRIDAETGYGIVTDVCLKRKIRNYVELVKSGEGSYNILVKMDEALNTKFTKAYAKCGNGEVKKDKVTKDNIKKAQEWMCKNYFDVRAFGAVMSTGENSAGIVRGPVQINFARSIDPIFINDISITRLAITSDEKFSDVKSNNEMGRKAIIPYALYRAEGYVSANLAKNVTGFNEEDLELLWNAIVNMFENDHSAARGKMAVRKLYVFKHKDELGNAPSYKLFDLITAKRKDEGKIARRFSDYDIHLPKIGKIDGYEVELIEKI
ncbi:MAG: type I-C CRISPR-associated protein Cas7/Csd2 [Christensenellaceae bacterium]|jgi:CRISPR-associated protein Csd2|nr:type I-C CRISPR-associated protein Cas7/Csd2 [Christensenellaceae bacterium]